MTDISYEEIETSTGVISSSFLCPLVHDISFLNEKYVLPKTAKDAFATRLGNEVLLVASPDLERYRMDWKKCWSVWFLNTEVGRGLKLIEGVLMTIEEVASFFECRQILCPDTGIRHPTTIAVNKLEIVRLYSDIIGHTRLNKYLNDKGY